jgi:hypothetical protein
MRRCVVALVLAATLCGQPSTAAAAGHHVRPKRADAAALVESALLESRTVRALVQALDATDVIVYVELARHVSVPRAGTALLTATAGVRYLLITVHPDHDRASRIAYLGHELQHALEIASNPHVTDQLSLLRHFQRIGIDSMAVGNFETAEAEAVGRRVWLEVSAATARRERDAAQSARPIRSWSFSR